MLWPWLAHSKSTATILRANQDGDASHPIVTSRFELFALRRTPPTIYTPYADGPPVLRIPYVWFDIGGGGEVAVVMLVGDKTKLGNEWGIRVPSGRSRAP